MVISKFLWVSDFFECLDYDYWYIIIGLIFYERANYTISSGILCSEKQVG